MGFERLKLMGINNVIVGLDNEVVDQVTRRVSRG